MKRLARSFMGVLALATAGGSTPECSVAFAAETPAAGDAHAHHQKSVARTNRQVVTYRVPEVRLVRDDGKTVSLPEELDDGRVVVLSFIYTTCTAVCPVTSQTLAQLQGRLGSDRDRVRLLSISVDPEQDTPARLAAYARKYGAGLAWRHYTGSLSASITTQQAFNVYRGDKMNHAPVTLLRAAPGEPWVRIEGFATANDLFAEVRTMLASN